MESTTDPEQLMAIYHALIRSPFHLALCVGCGKETIALDSGEPALCRQCAETPSGKNSTT